MKKWSVLLGYTCKVQIWNQMYKVICLILSGGLKAATNSLLPPLSEKWESILPPLESRVASNCFEQGRRVEWQNDARAVLDLACKRRGSFRVVWLPCRRDQVEQPWECVEKGRAQVCQVFHSCLPKLQEWGKLSWTSPATSGIPHRNHIQDQVRMKSHSAEPCPKAQPSKLWDITVVGWSQSVLGAVCYSNK